MNKVEQIKAKIEQLRDEYPMSRPILKHLMTFINSLQEEPVSEDFKSFEYKYIQDNESNIISLYDRHAGLVDGVQWQKEHDAITLTNEDVDGAAKEYSFNIPTQCEVNAAWKKETEQHFKDGARWREERMMKDAMKSFCYRSFCKDGDKYMIVTDDDDVKVGLYNLTEMGLEHVNTYKQLLEFVGERPIRTPPIATSWMELRGGEEQKSIYHCPHCGGDLSFDKETGKSHCHSCGKMWTYDLDMDNAELVWHEWKTM